MYEFLLISYLVVALALVGLVLIQHGKGADMGASFGAGASNTVFGSGGSGNFLTRTTATLAIIFFGLSLTLGNLSSDAGNEAQPFSDLETPIETVPAEETNGSDVPESN